MSGCNQTISEPRALSVPLYCDPLVVLSQVVGWRASVMGQSYRLRTVSVQQSRGHWAFLQSASVLKHFTNEKAAQLVLVERLCFISWRGWEPNSPMRNGEKPVFVPPFVPPFSFVPPLFSLLLPSHGQNDKPPSPALHRQHCVGVALLLRIPSTTAGLWAAWRLGHGMGSRCHGMGRHGVWGLAYGARA